MSLITRILPPDAKGAKLTFQEMDNNLYYLQSLGVSGLTFSANTLTITNPTGGTKSVTINTGGTFTGGTVSGSTIFINGLSANTISATTLSATTIYVGGNSINPSYKVYSALISQTSANTPTVSILENTLGYTPSLSRNVTGTYGIAVTSTTTNFLYFLNNNSTNQNHMLRMGTSFSMGVTSFSITTLDSGVLTDGLLDKTPIEIRIYN